MVYCCPSSLLASGGRGMGRCSVESIRLINYRNFSDYELKIGSNLLLHGPNGAGKSNILEGISLLYPGSGMRQLRYANMAKLGTDYWSVLSNVHTGIAAKKLDVCYKDGIKTVSINKAPVKNIAELTDSITIIWLTPTIIANFIASPAGKRVFFDRMTYAFDSSYANYCISYNKLLAERSKILRSPDDQWLSSVEISMAENMMKILQIRAHVLQGISDLLCPSLEVQAVGAAEKYSSMDNIILNLRNNRLDDITRGGSLIGTHRTRYSIKKQGMPFDLCSTGEQKSIMMQLILAQAKLKIKLDGIYPVILLDEVLASLCERSRLESIERIFDLQCQCIATSSTSHSAWVNDLYFSGEEAIVTG